jgi:hypothetical protein
MDPERPVKATAYLDANLDQETARRSPGTPSGLLCITGACIGDAFMPASLPAWNPPHGAPGECWRGSLAPGSGQL